MGVTNCQLTTNFSAKCQLTTNFSANCHLTTKYCSYLLTFLFLHRKLLLRNPNFSSLQHVNHPWGWTLLKSKNKLQFPDMKIIIKKRAIKSEILLIMKEKESPNY